MNDQPSENWQAGLEEKILFLERHIEEQDKEIYKQSQQLKILIQEVSKLKAQLEAFEESQQLPPQEKPPHY